MNDKLHKAREIVFENQSLWGKVFGFSIQGLIIISLVTFSIDTLPNLSELTKNILWITELVVVIIFTIEYIARLVLASSRIKFIFSFYGLIDLFAILPFYISTGLDLRSIRVFRLFRLARILKLARYNKAIMRFHKAIYLIKEELILFLFLTLMLLFLAAVGIYFFENEAQPDKFCSIFHSLWWAVATLTTVGYGDVYPITIGGKIFTFLILMLGLGIIAIPSGLIASAFSQARADE